jgi:hypothetical protein
LVIPRSFRIIWKKLRKNCMNLAINPLCWRCLPG